MTFSNNNFGAIITQASVKIYVHKRLFPYIWTNPYIDL